MVLFITSSSENQAHLAMKSLKSTMDSNRGFD